MLKLYPIKESILLNASRSLLHNIVIHMANAEFASSNEVGIQTGSLSDVQSYGKQDF